MLSIANLSKRHPHSARPVFSGLGLAVAAGEIVALVGESGVGKSTLLSSLVKNSDAEVCVLALVGERNREVRDFIENELGEEGMKKSVLIVATSDRPSPLRVRSPSSIPSWISSAVPPSCASAVSSAGTPPTSSPSASS